MDVIGTIDSSLRRYGPAVFFGAVVVLNVVVVLEILPAPRTAKLVILTVDAAALLGYMPAGRIVDYLWSPSLVVLLVVDGTDNVLEWWEMSPEAFSELTIDKGRLHQWEARVPVYECWNYNDAEGTVTATHRAVATDLQLLESEKKLEDVHGELADRADWGTTLRMRFLAFVRAATAKELETFTEAFETATLPDGDAIKNAVEEAKPDTLKDDRGLSKQVDESKVIQEDVEDGQGDSGGEADRDHSPGQEVEADD